jgi:hypothetical protein
MKFLRIKYILGFGLMAMVAQLHAERILINFTTEKGQVATMQQTKTYWNCAVLNQEIRTTGIKLLNEEKKPTGITLKVENDFYGAYDSGDNPQELYANIIGNTRWSLEKGNDDTGIIKLSGLSPEQIYDFHIFGTREAPVELAATYTIKGHNERQVNSRNRNTKSIFSNRGPFSDGTVEIRVSISSGQNAFINAMEIHPKGTVATTVAKPEPQPAPKPGAKPAPKPSAYTPPQQAASSGDGGSGNLILILGILSLLAGLGLVGGSIWYYLKSS